LRDGVEGYELNGQYWDSRADTNEAIRICGIAGNIIFVNNSFCKLACKSKDELVGSSFYFQGETEIKVMLNTLRGSAKEVFTETIKFSETGRKTWQVSSSLLNNSLGNELVLSLFKEVNQNSRAGNGEFEGEEAGAINPKNNAAGSLNNKTYEIIKSIFDNSDDIIWILDENLNFTYISPAVEKIRGYTPEEAMKQSLLESMSNEALKEVMFLIEQKKNAGPEEMKKTALIEARRPCKDGSFIWVESKVKFLVDGGNKVQGFIGISRDISDRKIAEQKLRDNRNYLYRIINTIGDPLFIKDSDFKCILANEAFCGMLGLTMDEVIGKYDYELFSKEECAQFNVCDNFVFETGRESLREESYTDLHGKNRTVLTRKKLFTDEGGKKFIIGTLSDITQLKEADSLLRESLEKEKQINSMKSDFVSMVSHEFRTPLTTILSSAQLIQQYSQEMKDGEREEIFGHIYKSVRKMISLLDDILLIGGTESGKTYCAPVKLNIRHFLSSIEKEIKLTTKRENISFIIDGSLTGIYADEKLLSQIINNLLTNAVKYSFPEDEIICRFYNDREYYCFDIIDNGIGINEEDCAKIFEPFFRGSNTGEVKGTGLGLAIVKKSVELHSGIIKCVSRKDKGTSFTVKIPINFQV
jgi:PAS domain S-box-containing protein